MIPAVIRNDFLYESLITFSLIGRAYYLFRICNLFPKKTCMFPFIACFVFIISFSRSEKRKIVRLKIRNFFRGSKKPSFDRLGLLISS